MNAWAATWLRLALVVSCAIIAHSEPLTVSYLTVSADDASVGDVVPVQFATGAAPNARAIPWPQQGIGWLCIRSGNVQENQHNVRPARDGEDFVNVTVRHPGVTLIAADVPPVTTEATPEELQTFFCQNVASLPEVKKQKTPPATVRVRRIESAKTLVRAEASGDRRVPSAIGTSKTGQPIEIRPVFDPSAIQVGSDLPLWIYIADQKKAGVKVQATHLPTGTTTSYITGPGSAGYFRVTHPGSWRVEVHHAEPLKGDADADWVIYSGTLTFQVPEKGADK